MLGSGAGGCTGRRCLLFMRQAVFPAMMRVRTNMTGREPAGIFGVDRTAVSQYVGFIRSVLAGP